MDRGNTYDMTASIETPTRIENNPLYDAKVTKTTQFGEHEIAQCDDGSVLVDGEHVCMDMADTDTELEDAEPGE